MKPRFQRGMAPRGVIAALVVAILFTASAAGQQTASELDSGIAPIPQTDAMDLLGRLLHKEPAALDSIEVKSNDRSLLITPVLNYNPVTSVIFGVGLLTSIYHGDPKETFPSTVQAGASISLEEQLSVSAKFDTYSDHNRWFFQANPAWAKYPQSMYDLGTNSPTSSQVGVNLYILKVLASLNREVLRDVFTGIGLLYVARTDIEPTGGPNPLWDRSAYLAYSRENDFDITEQTSAGLNCNLLFDGRDNPINASRGWFANASYRIYFKDFLGGTSDWQELYVDLRTYRSLDRTARHRLGLWLYTDIVTDGTAPFFDLPTTGAVTRGRAGRGYDAYRFRGDQMAYAELEYRVTITRNGLLGAVAFINTETFGAKQTGSDLFYSYDTAAGIGVRILVDKRAKSNLCFDVGFGKDGSSGLWAGFQETF